MDAICPPGTVGSSLAGARFAPPLTLTRCCSWSLAKMNHHPGEEFLDAMAEEVAVKAKDGNAQNLANMIW